ncbi:MAG: RNA polymerase sigma factor [Bradymonadia bacterium]
MTAQALTMSQMEELGQEPAREDPEAALVDALIAGDERAFARLYRDHSADVFRLARRFVYSDAEAEEVVQEVFLAAFKYIGRFRRESRLKTWLYRITVNRALKRHRWWTRRRESGPEPIDIMKSSAPSPEARASDRQALALVHELLNQLDKKKQTVLVLHELEGLNTQEIAEILECPRSTVLTRLARARSELIRRAQKLGVLPEEAKS